MFDAIGTSSSATEGSSARPCGGTRLMDRRSAVFAPPAAVTASWIYGSVQYEPVDSDRDGRAVPRLSPSQRDEAPLGVAPMVCPSVAARTPAEAARAIDRARRFLRASHESVERGSSAARGARYHEGVHRRPLRFDLTVERGLAARGDAAGRPPTGHVASPGLSALLGRVVDVLLCARLNAYSDWDRRTFRHDLA